MCSTNLRNRFLRLSLFILLTCAAVFQLRIGMFEQSEFSDSKQVKSLSHYQQNPRLLTYFAKQKHLFDADMKGAEGLYQKVLTLNAVYLPAWLGLIELHNDQGEKESANAMLEQVDIYSTGISRWRWDKALVAYELDRTDILAKDLGYIITNIGGKTRNDALRIVFSTWPEPTEALQQVGNDNVLFLFRYAIRKKNVDAAIGLWPAVRVLGISENRKDILAFLNMLISMDAIEVATDVWKAYFNRDTLLYNGNFQEEPMQSAFGWRLKKVKGSSFRFEPNKAAEPGRALHLHFKRQENLNYHHLTQIIPLAGGLQYQLTASVKSKHLSTDQLPFIEVYGYKCKAPRAQYTLIEEDQPWREFSLLFNVPQECSAMVVRLRRKPSNYIDNKLAGDLWLKDISITATGNDYTILDSPQ